MKNNGTLCIFVIIIIGLVGVNVAQYLNNEELNKEIQEIKEELNVEKEDNDNLRDQIKENNTSSSNNNNNSNNPEPEEETTIEIKDEYSNIKKISLKEYKEKIQNKESFVIVISQTSCYHCIVYKPDFNEALKKNKITGYELDIEQLSTSEKTEFSNIISITGTPTTLFYVDGVEQGKESRLVGVATIEVVENSLKQYNLIRE